MYFDELQKNTKLKAFISLLNEEKVQINEISKHANDTIALIRYIEYNKRRKFIVICKNYENRIPTSKSAYIYDDLLIFILIVGSKKFNLKTDWINNAVELRNTPSKDAREIKTTFLNIISNNYESQANNYGILLTFFFIYDKSLINNNNLKKAYESISKSDFPDKKNDFKNICYLKSWDLLAFNIELIRDDKILEVLMFEKRFKKRIILFSNVVYFIILLSICVYIYIRLVNDQKFADNIKEVGSIIGLLGISFYGILVNFFKKWIKKILYFLMGYSDKDV